MSVVRTTMAPHAALQRGVALRRMERMSSPRLPRTRLALASWAQHPQSRPSSQESSSALHMLERQSAYDGLMTGASVMMFHPQRAADAPVVRKTYPSYNLQPLLLKRYQELEEARPSTTGWVSAGRCRSGNDTWTT